MFEFQIFINGKPHAGFINEQLAQSCLDIICGEAKKGMTIELRQNERIIIGFDARGNQVV